MRRTDINFDDITSYNNENQTGSYQNHQIRLIPLDTEPKESAFLTIKSINSPYTVQHLGITRNGNDVSGVIKLIDKTLEQFIQTRSKLGITKIKICWQLAKALDWMHNLNPPVFHNGLTTDNIYIDSKYRPKIFQFRIHGDGHQQDLEDFKNICDYILENVENEVDTDQGEENLETISFCLQALEHITEKDNLSAIRESLRCVYLDFFSGMEENIGRRIWEKLIDEPYILPKDISREVRNYIRGSGNYPHMKDELINLIADACGELTVPPLQKYVLPEDWKYFIDLFSDYGNFDLIERVQMFLGMKGFFGVLKDENAQSLMDQQQNFSYIFRISNTDRTKFSVFSLNGYESEKFKLETREPDRNIIERQILKRLPGIDNPIFNPLESKFYRGIQKYR